jgi:hypothetical protein
MRRSTTEDTEDSGDAGTGRSVNDYSSAGAVFSVVKRS